MIALYIILGIVIVAFLGATVFSFILIKQILKSLETTVDSTISTLADDKRELIKALISKSLTEYSTSKAIEEPTKEATPAEMPDIVSMDSMDEGTFNNLIKKQLERAVANSDREEVADLVEE